MIHKPVLELGDVVLYEGRPHLVMMVNECRALIKNLTKTTVKVGGYEFEASSGQYNICPNSYIPVLETDDEYERALMGEYSKGRSKKEQQIQKAKPKTTTVVILESNEEPFNSMYGGRTGEVLSSEIHNFMLTVFFEDGSTVRVFSDEIEA